MHTQIQGEVKSNMRKFILLALALLLLALPVFAQDNTQWSAYLFDNINNALIHIGTGIETATYSLDVPQGSYVHGMSINPDGSQVAYCYNYRENVNDNGVMKLAVRDIDQEVTLFEQEFGLLVGCTVSAFNADVLALSLVYSYGFDNPTGKLWELRLLDPVSGDLLAALDNENPAMPAVEVYGRQAAPLLADVRELSRESVSFIGIPYLGTEGPAQMPAFTWDVTAGTVTELPVAYGYFNSDFMPETGEVVYSSLDENLPAAMPAGPIPQANIVKIVDAEGERVIYQNSDYVITATTFISNGQAVLVSMYPGFDEQNPDAMGGSHYALVERDGTVIEFAEEFVGAVFADAIPNGALLAFTPQLATGGLDTTQIFVLTSENILAFDSMVTVDYSLGWSPPMLVWTSASPIASDLSPFVGQ